ncbi:hypothetical protein HHL16_20020 [Pseudoflavitalea sp. G-6-1-2]|uniref:hypothetical protein n=1 Tax=Pseudoflavitalea sp. G-6-1-2 TaxID=2728841 RepID=UPI001469F01A|nr:hypothetical protein [Pseudoflavitalea sp. G-6-1-2]NML23175.1 hypothetical protein [Pseudoflavitalea sp. G-6-1-2]
MTTESKKGIWDFFIKHPYYFILAVLLLVGGISFAIYWGIKNKAKITTPWVSIDPQNSIPTKDTVYIANPTAHESKDKTSFRKIEKAGISNSSLAPKKDTVSVFHVESHNQQGGITAGKIENINIVDQPREFDGEFKAYFGAFLRTQDINSPVRIYSLLGDNEALRLANQIKEYIIQQGFLNVKDAQAIFDKPISNVHVDTSNSMLTIRVGSKL